MYDFKEKKIDIPENVFVELQRMGQMFHLGQIILFGSRARCTNGERSDIDLALYARDVKQYYDILDFIEEIETLLMFDVVDMNGSAFSNTLRDEIERDGVIIYEKI